MARAATNTCYRAPTPVDGALGQVTADAAYDTIGFYEAAGARGATVVVPPTSTVHVSRHGPRSSARDRTILAVKEIGQAPVAWCDVVELRAERRRRDD